MLFAKLPPPILRRLHNEAFVVVDRRIGVKLLSRENVKDTFEGEAIVYLNELDLNVLVVFRSARKLCCSGLFPLSFNNVVFLTTNVDHLNVCC